MKNETLMVCNKCGWNGIFDDLNGIKCPECNDAQDVIEEYNNIEALNTDAYCAMLADGKFNWNKC